MPHYRHVFCTAWQISLEIMYHSSKDYHYNFLHDTDIQDDWNLHYVTVKSIKTDLSKSVSCHNLSWRTELHAKKKSYKVKHKILTSSKLVNLKQSPRNRALLTLPKMTKDARGSSFYYQKFAKQNVWGLSRRVQSLENSVHVCSVNDLRARKI